MWGINRHAGKKHQRSRAAQIHPHRDRNAGGRAMSPSSSAAEAAEDEDDDEEFYESIDRILSCSSSDEDADRLHPSSYDLWISEPASVEERRRSLFHRMGLAAAPTPQESPAALRARDPSEMGRSVSCDTILRPCPRPSPAPVSRSRSDAFANPDPVQEPNPTPAEPSHDLQHLSSFGSPSRGTPFQSDYEDADDSGDGDEDEEQGKYTIRNLDTGKEFLVGRDGAWGELQEVGTGRQLTAEEFEKCVGRSPIVQELMRRQTAQDVGKPSTSPSGSAHSCSSSSGGAVKAKKRGSWMRSFRNVAGSVVSVGRDLRSSDERDTSSEKGGRRSSSATDDSQDGYHLLLNGPERVKARHCGKSHKELTGLYLSQVIQAHDGSIWCIKFCQEGTYLASAGEDCIIHVWKVLESERRDEFSYHKEMSENGNPNPTGTRMSDPMTASASVESSGLEKKRRTKVQSSKKSVSFDHVMVPELVFALSDTPVCSFKGHLADVLDLSWSKSEYLLSSSMDKTVRLWCMTNNSCLKTFAHSDYVTCIQFNPVDDRYFISGSLDEKVRIWSIPDRQVVDWNDLHGMVTAVCYTPDGQGAFVGSHKGSCHLYDTSENKMQQKNQIYLQNKKKKSSHKKITGFQFVPGSYSEVLITSADSRIRVIDGIDLIHKFKGFRNTSSQISSSLTANGKYVICASEDSHVYMWRYDADSQPSRSKGVVMTTHAYENFQCQGVTVAVSWPCIGRNLTRTSSSKQNDPDSVSKACSCGNNDCSLLPPHNRCAACAQYINSVDECTKHSSDRTSATWPEEKLIISNKNNPSFGNLSDFIRPLQSRSAWGLVIVTAGRGGEIKAFQNFGFPVRI